MTEDSRYGDSLERVLYNTIAGAKPILPDGTSFYYSDYNLDAAKKVYYKDKWPCCSGTFPQLAADYGISSYYQGKDGIYVNLFLPSKLTWTQNGSHCSLTQTTQYPKLNTTELRFQLRRPENFTVHLRVPAWADAKTRISVNGKRAEGDATPGKFFAVTRTWKNGDRLEFEMGMPWRLEAVDAQNPDWVALLHGPLSLFGTAELPARVTRAQLLAARPSPADSDDFVVTADAGKLTFRPFARIADEPYRLYQRVSG